MTDPSSYRADKSGFAREAQAKLDAKFDAAEAARALRWIRMLPEQEALPDDVQKALHAIPADCESCAAPEFHQYLYNGLALGGLMSSLQSGSVKFGQKTWQVAGLAAFEQARRRERIGLFLKFVEEYGVGGTYSFQTDQLYEQTNLVQVVICISQLGTEAQSKGVGPAGYWMAKHQENKREFSEEKINEGKSVIGLQMGSNKGASAAGVSFGSQRHITDSH